MPGGPAPLGAFYNNSMTPSSLLGLPAGTGSKAAGASLPPVTHSGPDKGAVPWHPDSPLFWLVVIGGLTVAGVTGASVRVRAFKGRAGAEVGTT